MTLTDKQKNRLRRLKLASDEGALGLVGEINEIEEKIGSVLLEKADKKDLENVLVQVGKMMEENEPQEPEVIEGPPGPKGDDYILTEKDKEDIVKSIKVPVVEKVIEKTETIREIPIVTENVVEVAVKDTPQETRNKLASLNGDERLDKSAIKGLDELEKYLSERIAQIRGGISGVARGVQLYISGIKKGLANTLNLKAGTNVTITHSYANGQNDVTISATGGSGGGAWGSITGTLSDQTDLQTALDAKVDENVAITGATKTKITYDARGLVTAGADATTADIADSSNKRYVTDAQLVVVGNTSGTNTGDQTSIVGITGTKAQFDTAVTDGNFLYVGDVTQYTDEMAQDAVGTILTDSAEIDFTYNDVTPSVTASIVAGSIDETKLDTSVNASLDLADSALQSLSGAVLVSQATPQTVGDTTNRLLKLWATDITVTNAIAGSITGNAATVTTNANLTGVVTSVGNATAIADAALSIAKTSGLQTALDAKLDDSQATAFGLSLLDDTNSATALGTLGLDTDLQTLTIAAGSTLSGSNTGDNATNSQYSGLVTNATHTGDATGATALTLATVNANVGTFGSSTSIPTFTVNGKGLITAASGNAVVAPAGTLTGTTLASGVVTSSLTAVGTIATGTWNGTDIAVADGGTGRSTSTTAYALLASGTTATGAHQTLANGATTEILVGGGASALPVWTTATGTGAPARAGSPTFTTQIITPIVYGSSASGGDLAIQSTSHATPGTITIGSGEDAGQVGVGGTNAAGTGLYFYKNWSSNDAQATAIQFFPILETTTTGRQVVSIGGQLRPAAAVAQATGFGTLIQFGAAARQNTSAWNVTTLTGNQIRVDELADYSATVSTLNIQNIAAGVKGGTGTFTTMNVINIPAGHGTFGATNVRGFHGAIAAASNVYNIYNDGTAQNYFAGKVGCGIAVPTTDLHVYGADNATHLTVENAATSANTTASDVFVDFRSSSGSIGTIAGTATSGLVAYNTFTGSHWAKSDTIKSRIVVKQSIQEVEHLEEDLTTTVERIVTDVDTYESDLLPGTVLVSTDEMSDWGEGDTLYLPMTAVSSKKEDKAVYGVYGGHDRDGDILVLAVGAGTILVTDEGGKIEVGDFLCTSSTAGHAMRYDGNDMRVVVAKARGEHKAGKGLIPCTYLAG
jgi:hypothetical protein